MTTLDEIPHAPEAPAEIPHAPLPPPTPSTTAAPGWRQETTNVGGGLSGLGVYTHDAIPGKRFLSAPEGFVEQRLPGDTTPPPPLTIPRSRAEIEYTLRRGVEDLTHEYQNSISVAGPKSMGGDVGVEALGVKTPFHRVKSPAAQEFVRQILANPVERPPDPRTLSIGEKAEVHKALYDTLHDYQVARTNYHIATATADEYAPAEQALYEQARKYVQANPKGEVGAFAGAVHEGATGFSREVAGLANPNEMEQFRTNQAQRYLNMARSEEHPIGVGWGMALGNVVSPESIAAMIATAGVVNPIEEGLAAEGTELAVRAGLGAEAAGKAGQVGAKLLTATPKAAGMMTAPQTAEQIASGEKVTPGSVVKNVATAIPAVLAGEAGGALTEKAAVGVPASLRAPVRLAGAAGSGAAANIAAGVASQGRMPTAQEALEQGISGAVVGGVTGLPGARGEHPSEIPHETPTNTPKPLQTPAKLPEVSGNGTEKPAGAASGAPAEETAPPSPVKGDVTHEVEVAGAKGRTVPLPEKLFHGTDKAFEGSIKPGPDGVIWYGTSPEKAKYTPGASTGGRQIADSPPIKKIFYTGLTGELNVETMRRLANQGIDALYDEEKGHVAYIGHLRTSENAATSGGEPVGASEARPTPVPLGEELKTPAPPGQAKLENKAPEEIPHEQSPSQPPTPPAPPAGVKVSAGDDADGASAGAKEGQTAAVVKPPAEIPHEAPKEPWEMTQAERNQAMNILPSESQALHEMSIAQHSKPWLQNMLRLNGAKEIPEDPAELKKAAILLIREKVNKGTMKFKGASDAVAVDRAKTMGSFQGGVEGAGKEGGGGIRSGDSAGVQTATPGKAQGEGGAAKAEVDAPVKEPWQMTRAEFYEKYTHQHGLLKADPSTGHDIAKSIEDKGFERGLGPNAALITRDRPRNVIEKKYGTRGGRPVYALPGDAIEQTGNGPKIKSGYKPTRSELAVPIRDYEPLHEALVREAMETKKPVPPEVLAEYSNLNAPESKSPEAAPEAMPETITPKSETKAPEVETGKGRSEYTIGDAKYAKGQKIIKNTSDGSGWKSRAAALAEEVGGRWSNREKGYILSPTKAAKFEEAFKNPQSPYQSTPSRRTLVSDLMAGKISNEEFDRLNKTTDEDLAVRGKENAKNIAQRLGKNPDRTGRTQYESTTDEIVRKVKADFGVDLSGKTPGEVVRETARLAQEKAAKVSPPDTFSNTKAALKASRGPGAAQESDPAFRAETGGAAVTPENAPRVLATTVSPQANATRQTLSTMDFVRGKLKGTSRTARDAINAIADSIRRYAQQSFPALIRGSSAAGDAAATMISSRELIRRQSEHLTAQVREAMGGDEAMDRKLGAVLVEDQLKGIRQKFTDRMNEAIAASAKAKTPEESAAFDAAAAKNRNLVANVKTLITAPDSPFKTEADYNAALNDQAIQNGLAAHRQFVEPVTEENYRLAKDLDPEQELPARGADTNSHISLKAIQEDQGPALTSRGLQAGGNIENTLRKYSPFDRDAKGNAKQYELSYSALVKNSIERGTLPAGQARLYKALQDAGIAVVQRTGPAPTIDGRPTIGFKIETKPGESLYVCSDVAPEVRLALNIDKPENPLAVVSHVSNQIALLSMVEAISHASNHLAVLYKSPLEGYHLPTWLANVPGAKFAGILDAVGTNTFRMLTKRLATLEHLSGLANLGALKPDYSETEGLRGGSISKLNPARYVGKLIDTLATASRLAMDDGFKMMVERGLVQDTPRNRRDYINQLGQYHKEAQAGMVRVFRNIGLGPFATAGSTFYTQGLRTLTGSTGAKGTSLANAAKLRAYVVAQIGGTLALVALTNYLRTGKIQPPATPWGSLLLKQNADGSATYEDIADLIGIKRAARTVGADAAIESGRTHRPAGTAVDKSARQAISAAASPFMGPLPTAAITAATGTNVHGLYDAAGRAGPGETQTTRNVIAAAKGLNPTVGLLAEGSQEGKTGLQQTLAQLGRFTPKTGTVSPRATVDTLVDALRKNPKDEDSLTGVASLSFNDKAEVQRRALYRDDKAYDLLANPKRKIEDMVKTLEGMSVEQLRAPSKVGSRESYFETAALRVNNSNPRDPAKLSELKARMSALRAQ